MVDEIRAAIGQIVERKHDDAIALHHRIFSEYPPDDRGCYAYTYYDLFGNVLYHGYTTNARQRAKEHQRKAPWAAWADRVRYRECSSPHSARKLERRLQNKIPSLCHMNGMTFAYHGVDWSEFDREMKINHVGGYCKLPGGLCDVDSWIKRDASAQEAA